MVKAKRGVDFHNLKMTKTESLREAYSEVEEMTGGSISNSYFPNPDDQLDALFATYELTEFQKRKIGEIYPIFSHILDLIDPEKLTYEINVNCDQDLILSKNDKKGLSTLIIHDDELIVYSFISKISKDLDKYFEYEEGKEVDLEALVYKFLANN